ncbi:hypothetical protein ANCDUO_05368 [Ancylostoma duodenale]|uniref:Uncharacterized protein n=1 Tax=Ancylostoma duodenale TaxID=51022 RepID=A0A0C2DNQ4_9BILA|nr:hypothetical protein ANCDUO_05368 [Ancylostoma duodenale]
MFFAVCGWIMMNDDVLEFCNPVVGIGISIAFQVAAEIMPVIVTNLNYYVCFWRSSDYRKAFKEQFNLLLCKRVSAKQSSAPSVRFQ